MEKGIEANTEVKRCEKIWLPRWILIVLVGVGCIILAIFSIKVNSLGYYAVEDVILSGGLEDNQPVDIRNVFKPSDTIICTVKTTGIDGITIGMQWYLGDKLIYEQSGKTENNTLSIAIWSNKDITLPEGKYHVDVSFHNEVLGTVYFEVKAYHPNVNPPIVVPEEHKSIELPWYPEVPFAFDETWTIDGTEWVVNEVKIVLRDDTPEYFVNIVIDTDRNDFSSLSEGSAKEETYLVALYALENGYVEKARGLEIDGKYYDLDQYIIVTLRNPQSQQAYRVKFAMDDLVK